MHIRPATIGDSADLAILDDMAGHGLPSWLGARAVARGEAGHAFDWLRTGYAHGDGPANWTNGHVAEIGGEVAGMAVGYPLADGLDPPAPAEPVLEPVFGLFGRAAGGWLIDALAVYWPFRKRGIARALLRDQVRRAGGRATHLVVSDDNLGAIALYESEGFEPVAREAFIAYLTTHTTRDWLLMRRASDQEGFHG
ncbi:MULTISPECIES: GNAT family N-acetyltransferase [unclassified Roseitalea]|uniref:GNAT family N-acetyltransferase n=1 Tax=unclassified Roseitalea TaxID=2639107 RepID=UPI00273D7CE6|nr:MULTISPECIES: GNAT family N-acetyltransferase [unclassified Roseitalea]